MAIEAERTGCSRVRTEAVLAHPLAPEKVHFVKIGEHEKASVIGPCRSENWPFFARRQQRAETEKTGRFPVYAFAAWDLLAEKTGTPACLVDNSAKQA